jgi:hypothetical protein
MDLVSVFGGSETDALSQAERFLRLLDQQGHLKPDGEGSWPNRRDRHLPVDAATCVGRKLGYGEAAVARLVAPHGAALEVASNDHPWFREFLAKVPAFIDIDAQETPGSRTIVHRTSRGLTPRRQQVFDDLGNELFASRDPNAVRESFGRIVAGYLTEIGPEGIYVDAPAIVGSSILLVHPALRSLVFGYEMRSVLTEIGAAVAPAPQLSISKTSSGEWRAETSEAWWGKPEPLSWPIVGLVQPVTERSIDRVRLGIHLASPWTQAAVDGVLSLMEETPVFEVPWGASTRTIVSEIVAALGGAADGGRR